VTIIIDTAPIVALANRNDPAFPAVERALRAEPKPWIIPAPVTAEIDYFLSTRLGSQASRQFMSELAGEVFRVECLEPHEYARALALDEQYAALNLGLADASVVVLARRFETRRILTFDARHFRAVAPLQGGAFTLLPEDG
jgi:hypothetical protein